MIFYGVILVLHYNNKFKKKIKSIQKYLWIGYLWIGIRILMLIYSQYGQ